MTNGMGLANLAAPGGMMGGLMNNPMLRLGLSILSQPGGMRAGQQIGTGLLSGLAGLQEQQQEQARSEYLKAMAAKQQQEAAAEASQLEQREQYIQGLPPEEQVAARAMGDVFLTEKAKEFGPEIEIAEKRLSQQAEEAQQRIGIAREQLDVARQQAAESANLSRQRLNLDYHRANLEGQRFLMSQDQYQKTSNKLDRQASSELRKEFNALDEVKNYKAVIPAVRSARGAADNPSGDLNLIYAAAKVMDPGSVVRESEQQMIIGAASPAQKYMGLWNYVLGGGRITKETRSQMMGEVESRGKEWEGLYNIQKESYKSLAGQYELPEKHIFPSEKELLGPPTPEVPEPTKPSAPGEKKPLFMDVLDDETGKQVRATLDKKRGLYFIERGGQRLYMQE